MLYQDIYNNIYQKIYKIKNLFVFFALICFGVSLTACHENPSGGVERAFFVNPETRSGAAWSENGDLLARYEYQIPVMTAYRRDGADFAVERAENETDRLSVAEIFNTEFQQWTDSLDFPAMENAARLAYQRRAELGQAWEAGYYQNLNCEIYQNGRLVSVAAEFDYFDGGAHMKKMLFGWNFDIRSGRFFNAGDLFDDTSVITKELIRQASERGGLDDNYADILTYWSDSTAAVTFRSDCVTIAYSPYDLTASYDAGPQIFTVDREKLEPYLNEYGKKLLSGE